MKGREREGKETGEEKRARGGEKREKGKAGGEGRGGEITLEEEG